MQSMSANEAKTRFAEFIDRAQRAPVCVKRRDRIVGVLVSAQDYAAMRAFYANRLKSTLHQGARDAEAAGLTTEQIEKLLADES